MKRKNFVISEFRFVSCLMCSTDFALLNHRLYSIKYRNDNYSINSENFRLWKFTFN
jgi:hypothetical protein